MLPVLTVRKFLLSCGVSASVSVAASAATFPNLPSKPPKISPDLASPAASTTSVIIQYASPPTSAELQQLTSLGGSTPVVLKGINALQLTLPSSALQTLSADTNIRYISPDRTLVTHGAATATSSVATSAEYTAEPINAPAVWASGYYGSNIGVAVIDSGINGVRDLQAVSAQTLALITPTAAILGGPSIPFGPGANGRVVYNQSFVPGALKDTSDAFGHGTHVAGLIGGNGTASYGLQFTRTFYGIAPTVSLLNLKVLDANGQGTDTAVIQAIDTAIALKKTYNIRVINLSLGRPVFESYALDPLCQEVELAWKAGIVVVAAAGNAGRDLALNTEGYGTIEAPGNDPYVLTVGAVRTMGTPANTDDAMASYSSKGPSFIDQVSKPDIVAPGNLVTSLHAANSSLQQNNPSFFTPMSFYVLGGKLLTQSSPDYMPLSGTSMATGVASGAVALLLNANPALTPDQVKALLMENANKAVLPQTSVVTDAGNTYTAHNDVFTVGAGYLDIAAAVKNAKTTVFPTGTAMSPIASYDPNSGTVGLVTDSTALWGRTALWGASNVYGTNAFVGGSTALWGRDATQASTALWGRDDPQAYTALWGSTALWGRATPDAAAALWGSSTMDGSTALWGRSTPSSSTALWGTSTLSGSTALWSTTTFATQ